jgi:hypothetical protein
MSICDENTLIKDWDLNITEEQVLRSLGKDPVSSRSQDPALLTYVARAIREAGPLMDPAVVYREYKVKAVKHESLKLAGDKAISGKWIVQRLAAAKCVAVIVCSLGTIVDDYIRACMEAEPGYALTLDAFGSAAVQALSMGACSYAGKNAKVQGWEATLPFSPGMEGWPARKGQQQIFSLLNPNGAGVHLDDSGMMSPSKSLSMIIGMGPEVANAGRVCDYCSMRSSCRYQDQYL